jgi:asparagine synthase (glutamine-hydrolysing)
MAKIAYLGGRLSLGCAERLDQLNFGQHWSNRTPSGNFFLSASGENVRLFAHDSTAILIRGYAAEQNEAAHLDLDILAPAIHERYRKDECFGPEALDGSFTIILMDAARERIILYRNLVGNSYTYYTQSSQGPLFSSNLADLIDVSGQNAELNESALPAYFLFRYVPGRETLARDIFRLMPGEMVILDGRVVRREQRQTFASFLSTRHVDDALTSIENCLRRILQGYAIADPRTVNLLSGGVDSSYLQALWNAVRTTNHERPKSFAVAVDHSITREDSEYSLSAAAALQTEHTLVAADEPYGPYLEDLISTTGEPPNHVQTAYFCSFSRHLVASGVRNALCGEGADGLFGGDTATLLQYAMAMKRWLPIHRLRGFFGEFARRIRKKGIYAACSLAEHVDDLEHFGHPINQISAFADWPSVEECFGKEALQRATAYRRSLVSQYAVLPGLLEQVHATAFLGEAMDSASLWATIFNAAGAELRCPFLDSRLLRVVANLASRDRFPFRRPKDLLRRNLSRYVSMELAYRQKRGFGQPIFEWMAPGGALQPWVERIGNYDFVPQAVMTNAIKRPSWFLYSLLCFDIWHKMFIRKSIKRVDRDLNSRDKAGPLMIDTADARANTSVSKNG